MNKIICAACAAFLLASASSCTIQYEATSTPSAETAVVSNELDGSLTVQVWGVGRNYFDATEQCLKNAVYDVIFKGVTIGNDSYTKKPLVIEPNAREKYADYFDLFFTDKGPYKEFVNLKGRRIGSPRARVSSTQVSTHRIVTVLRPQLKQRLIEDGIINN